MSTHSPQPQPEDLTLPIYKVIESREQMTEQEKVSFYDNDPVAGSEFREMATLFLQMHDMLSDLLPGFPARPLPASIPGFRGNGPAPESLHLLANRSQGLIDKTLNFTRPLRTSPTNTVPPVPAKSATKGASPS